MPVFTIFLMLLAFLGAFLSALYLKDFINEKKDGWLGKACFAACAFIVNTGSYLTFLAKLLDSP